MFNREDSRAIKGLAIIMMFWNHLFMHPDRIVNDNYWTSIFVFHGKTIEELLSPIFHISVSIYIFIAGYGFAIKYVDKKQDIDSLGRQLLALYKKYWIVFVIIVPVLFILNVLSFEPFEFFGNLIALSCTYCEEWWFFKLYIELIVIGFCVRRIFDFDIKKIASISLGICLLGYCGQFFVLYSKNYSMIENGTLWNGIYQFCIKQPIFIMGIICYKTKLFDKISRLIVDRKFLLFIGGASIFLVYLPIPETFYNILVAPSFIAIICLTLLNNTLIKRILYFFGKYSTYMWLVHSSMIYYIFQKQIYYFHNSLSCFVMAIIFALIVSLILNLIEGFIDKIAYNLKMDRRGKVENL